MTESEEASLRSILDDLIDLFGWEDKTPLHAALHVRNAVLNLRADLAVAENEANRLKFRLRETAQILIAEVGADGPMDAEDVARKAVERMTLLRTLADEKAHEAGVYARRMEEAQARSRRANLDDLLARIEQGARAVERDKIVAWLRTAPCNAPGHDPRWCQDCEVRECAADAIECGVHRNLLNNGDTKP